MVRAVAALLALALAACAAPERETPREHIGPPRPTVTDWARCEAPGIVDDYDHLYQAAARRWLPASDKHRWCAVKSLAHCESRQMPWAVSSAGCTGILQVCEQAWVESAISVGVRRGPQVPRANIEVGTHYLGQQLEFWFAPRADLDHWRFALANWSHGPTATADKWRRAGSPRSFAPLAAELPAETVSLIACWEDTLLRLNR